MKYEEFIANVRDDSSIDDRAHAERATAATLDVLGQRLAGGEPSDLASQLPAGLKELLDGHTGDAESFGVDEFCRRVAQREGGRTSPDQALEHARAVLATVARSVSPGEVDNLRSQLPAGYAVLMQ